MKTFTDIEYQLFENLAQAKSILRKNGGDPDSETFKKIIDTTNKDGWTGLITRLVYRDANNLGEVLSLYPDLKKSGLDLGKLNKMSFDDIADEIYDHADEELNPDTHFVGRVGQYLIFHVKTYKDGLKICSPSWCLKTKNMWDRYTKNGPQFVIIEEKYTNKTGKTKLLSPENPAYMGSYTNTKNPSVRYGITFNINRMGSSDPNEGRAKYYSKIFTIFDDNNKSIGMYGGNIESLIPILDEIIDYSRDVRIIMPTFSKEYIDVKNLLLEIIEDEIGGGSSFDSSIEPGRWQANYGEDFKTILDKFNENNANIHEWYKSNEQTILSDDDFTAVDGLMDYILYELGGRKGNHNGGHPLSGMFLNERMDGDHSFKYIYGFSNNKYGKMYILQSYDTIMDWYEYLMNNFAEVFLSDESIGAYGRSWGSWGSHEETKFNHIEKVEKEFGLDTIWNIYNKKDIQTHNKFYWRNNIIITHFDLNKAVDELIEFFYDRSTNEDIIKLSKSDMSDGEISTEMGNILNDLEYGSNLHQYLNRSNIISKPGDDQLNDIEFKKQFFEYFETYFKKTTLTSVRKIANGDITISFSH